MSMEYIRKTYKVPAKPGGRVEYTGSGKPEYGTIKSADGAHLSILLDGEKLTRKFHPTWEMRYLPDNAESNGRASDPTRTPGYRADFDGEK